ncbi:MAG: hypothetical protein ACK4YP_23845 [Myxococcota bacterium]
MRALLALSLLAALPACGVGGDTIGCDFRQDDDPRCQDRTGLQSNGFDVACEASGGVVIDGGCPTDGSVAGCTSALPGGDVTDWYYAPETLETVTATCESDGAALVEP